MSPVKTMEDDKPEIKVQDRRHWARSEDREPDDEVPATVPEEEAHAFRERAEAAEKKLYEYSAALQSVRAEQEAMRGRLERDYALRVVEKFGELAQGILDAVDDLDLALDHARDVPAAEPFARGVAIARERFMQALARGGIERIDLDGAPFDPNVAEAVSLEPVDDPAKNDTVVRTVRPGYRLGDRIVRPARVNVGRTSR